MGNSKNGGSAFPRSGYAPIGNGQVEGMSLRDYFAAKAMQGLISSSSSFANYPKTVTDAAYEIADHMLAGRAK